MRSATAGQAAKPGVSRRGGPVAWAGLVGACLIVGGCASNAPPTSGPSDPLQDEVPAPTVVLPAEPSPYELRQRERATTLARQGRLADAALTWELLATIRPRVPEYRERLAEVQKQIDSGVAERLQRGEQAAARGQVDAAMQQFLAALALQPDNSRAADALRAVERERIKRNHLGKLSRNTLTRRAMSEAEVGPNDAPVDAFAQTGPGPGAKAMSTEERNEIEHAALLASQGEWDGAITLLERRLRANRRDVPAQQLLADVYFQKAEATAPANRSAAIALLERSVRNDPRHPRAPARLRQLRAAAAAAQAATAAAQAAGVAAPLGTAAATGAPPSPGAVPAAAAARPATAGAVASTISPAAVKPTAATLSPASASAAAAPTTAPRR